MMQGPRVSDSAAGPASDTPSAAEDALSHTVTIAPTDNLDSRPMSPSRRLWTRFRRQTLGLIALGFLLCVLLVALIGPFLAPHAPDAQDLRNAYAPMGSPGHLFGTDQFGRDVLSRLIDATRVSVWAAVVALTVAALVGVPIGLIAGYRRGRLEVIAVQVADALMSFPSLILAVAIVAIRGPGLTNAMIAVGVTIAPRLFRLVRGTVISVREDTYVEAARSIGTPTTALIRWHILPNVMQPLIVQLSLYAAYAMLAEASLSYLGLGVQAPQASWGSMLNEGSGVLALAPHLVIPPGIAIALTVLSLNVLGDALRDSLGREVRS